jgi:tetratricopeptide (TPR) repeat protein
LIFLLLFIWLPSRGLFQAPPAAADRISEVKALYDAGRWLDVVQAVPESAEEPADLELYRGLALAHLQRWGEARKAFEAGLVRNPNDGRIWNELAGLAYREKQFSKAKRELRRALAINPADNYANDFLASIYFLESNLEATLKYWNRTGRPKLSDLTLDPTPKLNPLILDRAFAFSPGNEWRRGRFLTTRTRLGALDLFPHMRFDLQAQPNGSFSLGFHAVEASGWGETKWGTALAALRGLPYQSIYPEFYDLDRRGLNWLSFVRWDDEKRRVLTEIAAPFENNPAMRYRIYFDGRNENWDLTNTLTPSTPLSAHFNMEKAAAGAEFRFISSGQWQWNAAVEYSYRKFRGLTDIPVSAAPLFTNGSAIAVRSDMQRSLIRFPERRFTLDSRGSGELGTFFANPLDRYGVIAGSLGATWFPEARGEDYETRTELRAAKTFGNVPFDDLFMLGFDRDNDLWLRGHPGLRNGEKGNAPLGRDYILANGEVNKIVYKDPFFTLRAGPFLDTGKISDPSGFFGSPKWLWDTGIQAKVRILGSFEFVVGYGKDLRSGNNSFFTTVSH